MSTSPSLPWWGWAFFIYVVLNVFLRMDVGFVLPLVLGIGAAAVLGGRRRAARGHQGASRPIPPAQPPQGPTPGPSPWATSSPPPGPSPTDDPSPWGGGRPGAAGPGPGPEPDMPRIEIPRYPDGDQPASARPSSYPSSYPSAYPSSAASPSTDPVVSLGQLHLGRCSRDLHVAATTGTGDDVRRVLDELAEQVQRLLTQLGGAGALPGSGRKEFEAGLRRLQRDVLAARGEDPAGARVARVVRSASGMGQTGRYE